MKKVSKAEMKEVLKSYIKDNFSGYSEEEIESNMFFSIADVIEFMGEYKLK